MAGYKNDNANTIPLPIYYVMLYVTLKRKGLICAMFILHCIALLAVIKIVGSPERKYYLSFSTSEVLILHRCLHARGKL